MLLLALFVTLLFQALKEMQWSVTYIILYVRVNEDYATFRKCGMASEAVGTSGTLTL